MRTRIRTLGAALAVSCLVGCPQVNSAALKDTTENILTNIVQQAAIALKAVNDAGEEVLYNSEDVKQLIIDGKATAAKFSAAGELLLDIEPGAAKNVTVELNDGTQVQLPVKTDKADFGQAPAKYDAYVMPGAGNNQATGEMRKAGQGELGDVFKGKAVKVMIGEPRATSENVRRLFFNQVKVPRQSFFMENGDIMLHPSNLWVIAGANGVQVPPGNCPKFEVLQANQPPLGQGPAPTGQGPAPNGQGGPQLVIRLAAELTPGKFTVWTAKVTGRIPGPPPQPCPGQPAFEGNPPVIAKADLMVTSEEVGNLDDYEARVVVATRNAMVPQVPNRPGIKPGAPMTPQNPGQGGQPGQQPGQPGQQPGQPGQQPGQPGQQPGQPNQPGQQPNQPGQQPGQPGQQPGQPGQQPGQPGQQPGQPGQQPGQPNPPAGNQPAPGGNQPAPGNPPRN